MIFKQAFLATYILAGTAAFVANASPIHVTDLGTGLNFNADSSIIKLSPLSSGGTSVFFDYDIPGPDKIGETAPGNYFVDQHYYIYIGTSQTITDPTNFSINDQDILFDQSDFSITAYSILNDGTFVDDSNEYLTSGSGLTVTSLATSAVPLPSSAPMLGAALLVLGAVGYGLKRKAAAP